MTLPLHSYHSYEKYVSNLARAEKFYTEQLGYKVVGRSRPEANENEGMERLVLSGGATIQMVLSAPTKPFSVAAHYLSQHPEGIGFLNFRVHDIDAAKAYLEERNGTLLYQPQTITDDRGEFRQFAIATPLSGVGYRFIEDERYDGFGPSFELDSDPKAYRSPYGYECIDHVTCNIRTLQPLVAFYRDVLGFEEFWGVEFHTNDVNPNLPVGSGLKSTVWWHPESGIKFANNEPAEPYFRNSQIEIYERDNRGSGIQHVALRVPNILETMPKLRKTGCKFLDAPPEYYEKVPQRLRESGFTGELAEDLSDLAKHMILVDSSEKGYLLQVFSLEVGRILGDDNAGALFYEIIQREGDDGFGAGNFRALFETIEQDQIALEKTATELPLELL